jgi:hypothetical protein
MADDVLRQAIQGISDLILVPGLINLDFADVKTIMSGMGVAMMGTGQAEGENRAMQAAQKAISSPLLEDSTVNGARGVIINITGGPDLSLMEVNEASCVNQEAAHEDANIIFGAVVDPELTGKVKITVIATGFDRKTTGRAIPAAAVSTPTDLSSYTQHLAAREPAAAQASADAMPYGRDTPLVREAVPVTVPMGGSAAQGSLSSTPIMVQRRSALELSLPLAAKGRGTASDGGRTDEFGLELDSPLDVPAFLRRQS